MDLEVPGRKRTPDVALVVALNRGGMKEAWQQLDAVQSHRREGRLAIFWYRTKSKVWDKKPARAMEKSLDTVKVKLNKFELLHNLPSRSFSILESKSFLSS